MKTYFLTLIIFLWIDSVWLGLIAKNFYSKNLGFLLTDKPNLTTAFIFYILYIFWLYHLVLKNWLNGNLKELIVNWAIFWIVCYATYDLTNLATIKNWPIKIAIIDIIWWWFLTAVCCFFVYLVSKK